MVKFTKITLRSTYKSRYYIDTTQVSKDIYCSALEQYCNPDLHIDWILCSKGDKGRTKYTYRQQFQVGN